MVRLAPGETCGVGRGEPVVVIPVYGQPEFFERCLRSVLANTPASVPVLVVDDATPDGSPFEVVSRIAADGLDRQVHFLRQDRNVGFPLNVNTALAATAVGDAVLLNSD